MRLAHRTTVSAKGQFTIPKAIREWLRITPGDRIAITIDADAGVMAFTPIRGSIVQETAGRLATSVRRRK